MGLMSTMSSHGDVKVEWDAEKPEDVERARNVFSDLLKKGYRAFGLDRDKKGSPMRAFDPKAERIVMVPKISGG